MSLASDVRNDDTTKTPSSVFKQQHSAAKYLSDPKFTRILNLPDGQVVSYAESGDPSGFPVVFIPGSSGHRLWISLYDAMAQERGLRLLCFDRPGRGLSTPSAEWKDWSYDSFTLSFMNICQQLKLERFILCAHSTGCLYATHIYQAMKSCIVGSLRFISPWMPTNLPCMPSTYAVRRSLPPRMVRNLRSLASFHALLFPGSSWQIGSVSEREGEYLKNTVIHQMLSIIAQDDADIGYVAYEVDWLLALEISKPLGIDFKKLSCPILCWHGVEDSVIPLGAVLWTQREVKGFCVNAIAEGTHNMILDLDIMALVLDEIMNGAKGELSRN